MYYDRPPEELIFLTNAEHMKLHSEGKTFSEELIDLCNKYDFEDENFVLWICEDKVQMSIDKKLIKRLEKQNYKFEDL